jgi:hypothetical protein
MRVLIGLVIAGLLAGSLTSARAQEWCGFLDKAHSRVRCGFISVKDCKQALHNKKDAICVPSPSFAKCISVNARKG